MKVSGEIVGLELGLLRVVLPAPLGTWAAPGLALSELVAAAHPWAEAEPAKEAVRELLRQGGYKPSGRGKPASEYVQAAIPAGKLGAINAVVDVCNAASAGCGLPISVVDLGLTEGELEVRLGQPGESYVFNRGGQEIDVAGLLVLCDGRGPCANAVKDSQRTKTTDESTEVLYVVWGTAALPGRAAACIAWMKARLEEAGASAR